MVDGFDGWQIAVSSSADRGLSSSVIVDILVRTVRLGTSVLASGLLPLSDDEAQSPMMVSNKNTTSRY